MNIRTIEKRFRALDGDYIKWRFESWENPLLFDAANDICRILIDEEYGKIKISFNAVFSDMNRISQILNMITELEKELKITS